MNEKYYRLNIFEESDENNSIVNISFRYENKIVPYEFSQFKLIDSFLKANFTEQIQDRKYFLLLNDVLLTESKFMEVVKNEQMIDIFVEPK